jgi:hypothetical protein
VTVASQHQDDIAKHAPKVADAIRSVLADQRKVVGKKVAERSLHRAGVPESRDSSYGEEGAEALRKWYVDGGGGGIDWGDQGDWQQCVDIAGQYIDDPEGYCELRHEEATGMTTAEHACQDKD